MSCGVPFHRAHSGCGSARPRERWWAYRSPRRRRRRRCRRRRSRGKRRRERVQRAQDGERMHPQADGAGGDAMAVLPINSAGDGWSNEQKRRVGGVVAPVRSSSTTRPPTMKLKTARKLRFQTRSASSASSRAVRTASSSASIRPSAMHAPLRGDGDHAELD